MGFFFQSQGDKGKGVASTVKDALDPNKQVTDTSKLTSALGSTASVAVSIAGSLSNATEEIIKMDKRAASLVRNMGLTSSSALILKRELATAAIDIIKAGGDSEEGLKIAQEILSTTNKTAMVSGEIIANINATSKVTGQSAAALQSSFNNVGMEAAHITEQMKTVVNTASSMGVNAQAVSKLVVDNMDKMNKFGFSGGVKGLAEMASKSASMRVDMTQVFSLAEDLLSPEKAIEVASAFQRLGASSSQLADPLKLMDMAQNNVPELQNQLAKLTEKYTYFDKTTKTFQIMPGARRELMAIEKEIGVSYENLTKMSIEGAKLKQKMSEISFSGFDISDEQKTQIAQMAELKDMGGEQMDYVVKFKDEQGNVQEKTLQELQKSQEMQGSLKSYLEKQKEMTGKSMQEIAVDQLGYAEGSLKQLEALNMGIATLAAGSKGADDFLKGINTQITKDFGAATQPYSAKEMKANFEILDKSSDKLAKAADSLMKGDLVKAMESINASNTETVNLLNKLVMEPIKKGGITDITSLTKAMETFFPGFSSAANSIVSVLKDVFDIDDFIAVGGQIGKLNEGDLVLGGTKLLPPKQPTNVDDTKTALSSFTQEQLKNGGTTTNVNNNSNVSGDISLTLKIDAPNITKPMMDAITNEIKRNPESLMRAFEDRINQQTLPMGTKKASNGY
jgi:hypothetical protein